MRTKVQFISFEQVISTLRDQRFDVQELPEVAIPQAENPQAVNPARANSIFIKKYGAGAILAPRANSEGSPQTVPQHAAVWVHQPGFLVRGEICVLIDRGYQKFWNIKDLEIPAIANSLRAVHRFAEEVREAIGEPTLYNESLGSTSDVYFYDRVQGRDLPLAERPKPAWELAAGKGS